MTGLDKEKELEAGLDTTDGQDPMVFPRPDPDAHEPLENVGAEKELEARGSTKVEALEKTTTRSTIDSANDDFSKIDTQSTAPKKIWYKRMNPLKRRKRPPVPEERMVSREYNANFLSLLTFQWMAPLMTVCCPCQSVPGHLAHEDPVR